MTERDQIALQLLPAVLARAVNDTEAVARAFALADAFLAARDRKPEPSRPERVSPAPWSDRNSEIPFAPGSR
jgi:hypothetical protein